MPSIRRPKRVASTPNASRANQQRQAAAPRRGLRSRATRGEASGPVSVLGHPTSAAPVVPTPAPTAIPSLLPEDLVTTLVSSVTAAVTQQLSALLPSPSTALPGISPPSSSTYPTVESSSSAHATALVQGALDEAHSNISGQARPFTIPEQLLPNQPFNSASLPLDARVPDKIKEKIWREEFVDFGVLLSNPDPTARYEINVRPSDAGRPASLVLEPTAKSGKQIKNINDWLRAFHIFVSIYTQRYTHETPALMKYCQLVQDLAARDHNWFYYDENFRFLRQTQASQVPWATVHWELWLRSQNSSPRRLNNVPTAQNASRKPPILSVPRGFCYKFHRGAYCSGCDFKHVCFKCNGAHRSVNCNFRGSATESPNGRSPKPFSPSVANTGKSV